MKMPKKSFYPKSIIIGDDEYTIQFVNRPGGLKSNAGTCDSDGIISIQKGMTPEATFSTFLHEIIHAIDFTYELKLKHKTVYALEKAILAILKDNF